jgi:hypothetical protein
MDLNTVLAMMTEREKQSPPGARKLWRDAAVFVGGLAARAEARSGDDDVLGVVESRLLDSPPTPEQMIGALHAWIATYRDGTEGIIAHGLPGLGMTPLVTSRHHVGVQLEPIARHAMKLSQDTPHPVVAVRLVSYAMVDKPV